MIDGETTLIGGKERCGRKKDGYKRGKDGRVGENIGCERKMEV